MHIESYYCVVYHARYGKNRGIAKTDRKVATGWMILLSGMSWRCPGARGHPGGLWALLQHAIRVMMHDWDSGPHRLHFGNSYKGIRHPAIMRRGLNPFRTGSDLALLGCALNAVRLAANLAARNHPWRAAGAEWVTDCKYGQRG